MKKPERITLFNYQVIVGEQILNKKLLEPMIEVGFKRNPTETEMQQISATFDDKNERFIRLVFSSGSVYPLPPNVISIENGKEVKNRRKRTEIEPKFFYGLMDCKTGEVWLQYNKNLIFKDALSHYYQDTHIEVKQILDEEKFFNSLNELKEIKLGVKPDLFNQYTLSQHLQEDIYQFGAHSAEIIFKYREPLSVEKVKSIINKLFKNKQEFKKMVITGRNTDNLELVFNTNIVSSKINVSSPVDENGMVKQDALFNLAISRILEINP